MKAIAKVKPFLFPLLGLACILFSERLTTVLPYMMGAAMAVFGILIGSGYFTSEEPAGQRSFEEKLCSVFHIPFSLEETLALYEKGVAENRAEAQFRLGCCYLFAYGIHVNRGPKGKTKNHKKIQKGAALTELASRQGHLFAQYSLGNSYRYVMYRGAEAIAPNIYGAGVTKTGSN